MNTAFVAGYVLPSIVGTSTSYVNEVLARPLPVARTAPAWRDRQARRIQERIMRELEELERLNRAAEEEGK